MDELKNKTSHEISLMKDDKLREKIQLDEQHSLLQQDILNIAYEIDKLRVKKREKEMLIDKSSFNIKRCNAELKLLDSAFWSAKQSGI